MKTLSSRAVAGMLYRYASLLKDEHERQECLDSIRGDRTSALLWTEAEEAQDAANYLHELKEYL